VPQDRKEKVGILQKKNVYLGNSRTKEDAGINLVTGGPDEKKGVQRRVQTS